MDKVFLWGNGTIIHVIADNQSDLKLEGFLEDSRLIDPNRQSQRIIYAFGTFLDLPPDSIGTGWVTCPPLPENTSNFRVVLDAFNLGDNWLTFDLQIDLGA